jgi:hypothetical protein
VGGHRGGSYPELPVASIEKLSQSRNSTKDDINTDLNHAESDSILSSISTQNGAESEVSTRKVYS